MTVRPGGVETSGSRCPRCGALVALPCRACGFRPRPKVGASFARDAELGRLAGADISDDEMAELRDVSGADYLPSPAEIEAECLAIRDGWTEKERLRRAVGPVGGWLPQVWVECEEEGEPSGWLS